ncbi:MAG: bacillithiol biosynthesis deacetylase BshB1 [Armatimonadota bacterium]|nr:MAG: bacillithiol biosynthesis deacetylase BshB1 [Armatimonadota bacterium]
MIGNWQRVLVFAAHPDDEIIGCGGTIARLSAMGKQVFVVTFCAGETSYTTPEMKDKIAEVRRAEADACDRVLDITERVILGKPTQGVVNDRETYQECIRLIRRYRPDVIFTHWNEDKHRDHRAISTVTDEARWKAYENVLADFGEPWYTPELYYYEVLELFTHPSVLIDITDTFPKKQEAMQTQQSQFAVLPGIMDYIEGLAKVRGYARGTRYAEAFLRSNLLPTFG